MVMIVEQLVERMSGREQRNTRRNSAPVPLSTTDGTWYVPESNSDRGGLKPATNGLSYGTKRKSVPFSVLPDH
jgi:hypothetical protein